MIEQRSHAGASEPAEDKRTARGASSLEVRVAELTSALAARDARITELERLLEEARRSGKRQAAPFSKGDPKPAPERPGRKSGEAHGRHGHRMAPGPARANTRGTLPLALPGLRWRGGSRPLRRETQIDLPEPRPVMTRFRVPIGHCTNCRRRIRGRHGEQTSEAPGAAAAQIGPRATSWGTLLHYELGLSFGRSARLLGRLGIGVTAGALCQAAQRTGTALVPVRNEIVACLNASAMVVADETGGHVGGNSAWLWATTSPGATAYWSQTAVGVTRPAR